LVLSSIGREGTGDSEVTGPTAVSAKSEGSSTKFLGVREMSPRSRVRGVDVHGSWSGGNGGVSRDVVGQRCGLADGDGGLFSAVVEKAVPSNRSSDEGFEVGEFGWERGEDPILDVILESLIEGVAKGLIAHVEGGG
jgi:hypothetical protein